MSSFLEKLKKGMNIEENFEEEEEKVEEKEERAEEVKEEGEGEKEEKVIISERKTEPAKKQKTKKTKAKPSLAGKEKKEKIKEEKELPKMEKIEIEEIEMAEEKIAQEKKEKEWSSFGKGEEGQLAVDVYQTEKDLVVQSAVAGVKIENLDISIEKDIIAIKGSREKPTKENSDYLTQECFWGPFSREIIMPVETDPQRATAEMKNGILTIRIPRILREKKKNIEIKGN